MKLKKIRDQVVVVFGASSGIGRETAREFAKRGARVVVAARDPVEVEQLAAELRAAGGDALGIAADAADYHAVQAVADAAVRAYGRLDTWAHVAAVLHQGRFEDTPPEEFRRVMEINQLGVVHGALAALPHLRRGGRGAFIAVSSVEGKQAFPLQAAYAASKHGVQALMDALRMELAHDNVPISVTTVIPSSIKTEAYDTAQTRSGFVPRSIPPYYSPRVVARAIVHVAQHPRREVVVGGGGKALLVAARFAPALVERAFTAWGWQLLRTEEPRTPAAPDTLEGPQRGVPRPVRGLASWARPFSLYTWFELHPWARNLLALGLVSGAAFLVVGRVERVRRARRRGFRYALARRTREARKALGAALTAASGRPAGRVRRRPVAPHPQRRVAQARAALHNAEETLHALTTQLREAAGTLPASTQAMRVRARAILAHLPPGTWRHPVVVQEYEHGTPGEHA